MPHNLPLRIQSLLLVEAHGHHVECSPIRPPGRCEGKRRDLTAEQKTVLNRPKRANDRCTYLRLRGIHAEQGRELSRGFFGLRLEKDQIWYICSDPTVIAPESVESSPGYAISDR